MKKFISFSGGVESTTMCILYGKDATAIWADTGSEHKKMYERIFSVESEIQKIHPEFLTSELIGYCANTECCLTRLLKALFSFPNKYRVNE